MKTARRQARETVLQALYAWQLSDGDPIEQLRALEGASKGDLAFAETLLRGITARAAELEALIAPHLERPWARLSPVERSILLIGTFELAHSEAPFKVVINEAVELGKRYGGAEGYRFVNGVLEKVAEMLRPEEVARERKIA